LLLAALVLPAESLAQGSGTWEFGADLGAEVASREMTIASSFFSVSTVKAKFVETGIPSASIRIGYAITDHVQLEPSMGFAFIVSDQTVGFPYLIDGAHVTEARGAGGLGLNFNKDPFASFPPFLSTGMAFRFGPRPVQYSVAGSSRVGVPLELGARVTIGEGLALRFGGGGTWWMDPQGNYWSAFIRVGMSAFSSSSHAGVES